MRLAYIADIHLQNHKRLGGPIVAGINRRCLHVLQALERAVKKAEEFGCDYLIILGDLFDVANPLPQIITAARKALESKVKVLVLVGNHDQVSDAEGDHALGPLPNSNISIVDTPQSITIDDTTLCLVPFKQGIASEWLLRTLESFKLSTPNRILGIHLGIIDSSTPAFLRDANDAVPVGALHAQMRKYKFSHVFAGNWHNAQEWTYHDGKTVVQVGALAPTGWDNPGKSYGSVCIWDSKSPTIVRREYVQGPRFFVVNILEKDDLDMLDRNIEFLSTLQREGNPVYVRFKVSPTLMTIARNKIEQFRQDGIFEDMEVQISTEVTKEMARTAAKEAKREDSLEAKLTTFVNKMPLNMDGIDETSMRNKVLELSKAYLISGQTQLK